MVRTIIVGLFAFVLIALLVIWVISGGPRRLATTAQETITGAAPTTEEMDGFRLPWQPVQIFPTIDLSNALMLDVESPIADPQARLIELEAEYERLKGEADKQRTFGTPSKYAGMVAIVNDVIGVRSEGSAEYLQISASYSNTSPIDMTGWVLESALTGTRVALPPAASPFMANGPNAVLPLSVEPGGVVIVSSATSPVGVSFRENACTGYLGQFQEFNPPLQDDCPSPSEVLPMTMENLQRYGDACFDAVSNLPRCRFPTTLPEVAGSCKAFLTEYLSYNGCVTQMRSRLQFQKNEWRVFLGARTELWRDSHDAIRLLDAQGRTVSVFVY